MDITKKIINRGILLNNFDIKTGIFNGIEDCEKSDIIICDNYFLQDIQYDHLIDECIKMMWDLVSIDNGIGMLILTAPTCKNINELAKEYNYKELDNGWQDEHGIFVRGYTGDQLTLLVKRNIEYDRIGMIIDISDEDEEEDSIVCFRKVK
jgi:hypothetical protein